MIKNIIFDLGNVLISYQPEEYLKKFNLDEGQRQAVMQGVFKSKYWAELDRGTITEQDAVDKFCEYTPQAENAIRKVMVHWMDMLTPIPETIEILKELKAAGLHTFALSNYHEAAFMRTVSENDFFSLFDGKAISYQIKLIKPQREIYEYILSKYGLKPEECLFIDDMPENIEGAKILGINTLLYKNPVQLRKYLSDSNIL